MIKFLPFFKKRHAHSNNFVLVQVLEILFPNLNKGKNLNSEQTKLVLVGFFSISNIFSIID